MVYDHHDFSRCIRVCVYLPTEQYFTSRRKRRRVILFGTPFYNEQIRTISLIFGTLFDNIHVIRRKQNGDIINTEKVPISYGPKAKFIARLDERGNLDDTAKAITLPRLSYDMTSISYDAERSKNRFKSRRITSVENDTLKSNKIEEGVPYSLNFELGILTNTRDDMHQIVEQILPFFNPAVHVAINPIESLSSEVDQNIRFILNDISITDEYEGDFEQIRRIEGTLNFTVTAYFFRNVSNDNSVIKEAIVNYKDLTSSDEIKNISYAVTPSSASENDSFTITVTETFGYDQE